MTQFQWFRLHSQCGSTVLGSHQRHLPPPIWQRLVGFRNFRLLCAMPGDEVECRIYGGWVNLRSCFMPFVDQSSWNFQTM